MENITLNKCDFLKLLPLWMRLDIADISLAESIDMTTDDIMKRISVLSKWDRIDELSEERLDELAWEMNISWYRYDAPLKKKRNIIRNARMIHRKLGTKWAMEMILTCYFDESIVLEWWQYNGKPGHFKIQTINTATVNRDAEMFLAILDSVKRYSQVLDVIEVIAGSRTEVEYVIRPGSVDKIISTMKE